MAAPAISVANKPTDGLVKALRALVIPLLAIFTALLIGGIIILISGFNPLDAYSGLWQGSIGSPDQWAKGDWHALNQTLATATPYIFTTLAVAFSFKAGLFNIGAEGQLKLGAICAAWMGVNFTDLPAFIHIPLTLAAGWVGGAIWAAIPGALKAFFGAHEVITTIMLNYIAAIIVGYLTGQDGPFRGTQMSTSPAVAPSAQISTVVSTPNYPLHWGFFVAIICAFILYWVLNKTPFGFEVRTSGVNPSAARYAGISVPRIVITAMVVSGLLAGMAGAFEVMGNPNLYHKFSVNLGTNYGFNSIAIALLARNSPIAALPAAFLFAILETGKGNMQFATQGANGTSLPGDIISIIEALIIMFVAADQMVRWLYRQRASGGETIRLSTGWARPDK